MNLVGVQRAHRHDELRFDDDQIGGGGHGPVEILLGHAVDQIARGVGLPGADEGHVAAQRGLEDVLHAVDDFRLPVRGQERARGRGREEAADAGAAGANRFGQRALGQQLHRHRARLSRLHRLAVAGEVGADGLADLAVAQQPSPTQPDFAHIVGNVGQVAYVGRGQRVEQMHRIARHAEAAHQERIA